MKNNTNLLKRNWEYLKTIGTKKLITIVITLIGMAFTGTFKLGQWYESKSYVIEEGQVFKLNIQKENKKLVFDQCVLTQTDKRIQGYKRFYIIDLDNNLSDDKIGYIQIKDVLIK